MTSLFNSKVGLAVKSLTKRREDFSPSGYFGRRLAKFRKEELGTMTPFALMNVVMIAAVCGLSLDFMRAEATRSRVQNTLDRAILAAADMDQTLDPELVVRDYFEKAGLIDYLLDVDVDQGLNYRRVTATAQADVPTLFIDVMGIPELKAPGVGTAEERVSNVEISMVLDISGSMRNNNRITNMRVAAKDFVSTVLNKDAPDMVSISLIPYTTQVNAGRDLYAALKDSGVNINGVHSYSHCLEFSGADFGTGYFRNTGNYRQFKHFEMSNANNRPITNPECPDEWYEEIVPFSQNEATLHSTIDNLVPRAYTSIELGMKWGVLMLDSDLQPVVQTLTGTGKIDNGFSDRPRMQQAVTDGDVMKVVVIMTDGENVATREVSDRWYYGRDLSNNDDLEAQWDKYPVDYWVRRNVSRRNRGAYYRPSNEIADENEKDDRLSEMCSYAKDNNITVYAVAFEAPSHGVDVMRDCASDGAFFDVDGLEISEAFNSIARTINQLRLIN